MWSPSNVNPGIDANAPRCSAQKILHKRRTHSERIQQQPPHVQHSAAERTTAQRSAAQHSTAQRTTAQRSTSRGITAQHSTVQHSIYLLNVLFDLVRQTQYETQMRLTT